MLTFISKGSTHDITNKLLDGNIKLGGDIKIVKIYIMKICDERNQLNAVAKPVEQRGHTLEFLPEDNTIIQVNLSLSLLSLAISNHAF